MPRRLAAALLLTGCLALPTGCFVLDELDAGQQMMEQNSPKPAGTAAAGQAPDEGEPGPPTGAQWWSGAQSLNRAPDAGDPGDPKSPVRCRIGGDTRFMRRGDCVSQGGRPAS